MGSRVVKYRHTKYIGRELDFDYYPFRRLLQKKHHTPLNGHKARNKNLISIIRLLRDSGELFKEYYQQFLDDKWRL